MSVFGTEMHLVTFIFTITEILMFLYAAIYFLSRPTDITRKYYLILLLLLIIYNIAGGLFPDKNLPIPLQIQYILAYASGFIMAMYFPFYFYKAWELQKLKFHAYYGVFVFLLLPFIVFFVIIYLLTNNIDLVRKLGVVIPFFYSLSLFYSLTKAIIYKYKQDNDKIDKKEIIGFYLAVIPWMSITIVTYFNASQAIEVSFTNSGFIIATMLFVRKTIKQSHEEYDKLLSSQKELSYLNASLTEQVKERTKQLEESNEQKINTFINLAHETKTPLTLIINSIEDYISKHGETEDFKLLKHSISKLKNDIINFFDLERFNKGFDFYNHEQIANFSHILKENILLYKHHCKKKNIGLKQDIDDGIFIKSDPIAINRLINNLIINAVKFTPDNGTIDIILKSHEGRIKFFVTDTGRGIPPELHSKIFEPYFQINSDKENFQGMGLGLSIVRKIVDSLKGEIIVISNPKEDIGTIINVILSKHNLLDDESIADFEVNNDFSYEVEILRDSKEIEDGKQSILLVEDNISTLNFLTKKLEGRYNVYATINGIEALKKLNEIRLPDLIISDVQMDQMNGFEFIRIISEDKKYNHIPMIFLTAKSAELDKMKGLRLGAIDYIQKPFLIDEVIQKVESVLENLANQRRAILEILLTETYKTLVNPNQSLNSKPNQSIEDGCKYFGLTSREIEIVKEMANGLTYKSIGEKLFISGDTVKKHAQNIFDKVGVTSKFELLKKLQSSNS